MRVVTPNKVVRVLCRQLNHLVIEFGGTPVTRPVTPVTPVTPLERDPRPVTFVKPVTSVTPLPGPPTRDPDP